MSLSIEPLDVAPSPVAEASYEKPSRAHRSLRWHEHEVAFGLFLAITWIRLVMRAGPIHNFSLTFLCCLVGGALVLLWDQRNPTPLRSRIRLLYYPVVMGICFFILEEAIPQLGAPGADAALLHLDRLLLGETPSVSYMAWDNPWLNDVLMVGYLFFFYYLVVGPAYYCVHDLPRFRKCFAGLFSVYALGLFFYTVLPAGGPHVHLVFSKPLEGVVVIPGTLALINAASNGADVFPSLHFGVSLYLLVFDWWHRRRHFWWCLLPCVALWLGAVLLRFHYFVDLLGGLAVALLGLGVAWWHERRTECRTIENTTLRA